MFDKREVSSELDFIISANSFVSRLMNLYFTEGV